MPSNLDLARRAVREATEQLRLATIAGNATLREAGAIGEDQWAISARLAGELEARLGELEQAEREAGLR